MRILIIRSYSSYMDVERNTYNIQEVGLAKALVRKGHVCDIVFWTDKEEKDITIAVEDCGNINVFYRHGKTALKNTVYTNCTELFEQYDILQAAEYNQMQSWMLAKQYPKKAIIYHGPYYSHFNKRYNLMCSVFDMFFLKRYLKLGTHFITKSKMAQEFLESKGIKRTNIGTVGVGMDTQMLSNSKEVCKEPLFLTMSQDKNLKLLYIGKFEKRRNIHFILDVFSQVINKKMNATLYMIGTGDKDYIEDCWKYAESKNIKNYIVYQEKMEQKYLAGVYGLADFFLLPTEYEIFGMVLLEAMYYHSVVLTTLNGGSSTLIDNNKNGFILTLNNAKEWADCIEKISSDKNAMLNICDMASRKIQEGFTWDKLADQFIEHYNKVLQ